jgi:hypothetical protein
MQAGWPPKIGDEVRVKWAGERGPVVSIEGSGESAVYAVNSRRYRFIDPDGQIKNTALEPRRCSISELEPIS